MKELSVMQMEKINGGGDCGTAFTYAMLGVAAAITGGLTLGVGWLAAGFALGYLGKCAAGG